MEVPNIIEKIKKQSLRCAVPNCKSKASINVEFSFHYFPPSDKYQINVTNDFGDVEKVDLYSQWKKVTNIFNPRPNHRVCSRHFKTTDYCGNGVRNQRRKLKCDAIPSLHLPVIDKEKYEKNEKRLERVKMRTLNVEMKHRYGTTNSPEHIEDDIEIPENIQLTTEPRGNFKINSALRQMGKKRSGQIPTPSRVKVEVKDEIPDNEVHVARDRLKGALRELLHHSDEGSSMDSSEDTPPPEMKHQLRKTPKPSLPPPPVRRLRRRRQLPADQLFHHTYVMKLFDRSVDLAQFREDTPLYPICRAWLANQPRNPNLVPKIRSPSPEIIEEVHSENILEDANGELRDVYSLPAPLPREEILMRNRIPSPIPQPEDKLELNYEGQVLKSRELLMKGHRAHWSSVRRKWHAKAQKNEKRFYKSAQILGTIFKRAQTEFE